MFNRIKKYMPAGITTVGFIISGFLFLSAHTRTSEIFSYEAFIMGEHLRETAAIVLTECIAGAIAFKICLKKEKCGDRGFRQK